MAADGPLPPGSVIGILGGGQLGRMLATAAAELGFRCRILAPEADSPAFDVAEATVAGFDDEAALAAFADAVDVVTYEFENVPVAAAEFLARRRPVRPSPQALAIAQDRLEEKRLAERLGLATAPFAPVDGPAGLAAARRLVPGPAILKSRRLGYDGKGQARLAAGDDGAAALAAIGGRPAILEAVVPFAAELSALVARGVDGSFAAFDVPLNRHQDGILATSTVPAPVSPGISAAAVAIGRRIAEALDYVGVLAVELFLVEEAGVPRLLFNEIAPRVHNSGHWTQDCCLVSQFEQHIRAIAGWPLADPRRHSDGVMENLIGAAAGDWRAIAAEPGARLHLYGKREIRAGRKMGHVNRATPRRDPA